MSERLRFGTAGLRGALGDGPNRMNVQVVWQAATAVARWLPAGSLVIIGHDARHGSADFAGVSARVLLDAGHRVQIFDRVVPTPVVAYAVGRSEAAAGVMVTASHNPAADNGYKVYAADGGQILPDDAHAIEAIMDTLDWPDRVDATIPDGAEWLGDEVIDAYMAQIGRPRAPWSLRLVYSAMHGVGGELCVRALESGGHEVHPVPEQQQPDPDFPTASFPNPEEPGTLDLAFALADEVDADLVLANDPDADRLAVAVRRDGDWTRLTGDEIGILLGDYLLARTSGARAVVTTIVSSSLLAKIAAAAGVEAFTVLTGFKWLAHAAAEHPQLEFVLGYEEALGYSVDLSIRDKDGISAALVVAELAAELRSRGEGLDDALDRIYAVHGVHVSGQVSKWFEGDDAMQQMTALMERLRATPLVAVGDAAVEETRDLVAGDELPPSDVLIYSLDGGRLIIRPSGTEPKVKAYVEAVASTRPEATRRLDELLTAAAAVLET